MPIYNPTSGSTTGFTSRARAALSANQTVTSGTITKVNLDSEIFDGAGEYDPTTNYRFTATSAGQYIILGVINGSAATSISLLRARFYKNGLAFGNAASWGGSDTTGYMSVTLGAILDLSAGDYIELWGEVTGIGAPVIFSTAGHGCTMSIHRLS